MQKQSMTNMVMILTYFSDQHIKEFPSALLQPLLTANYTEKKSATAQTARKKKTMEQTGSFLGSKLQDGDRVVMIEDVTTSGKSMEETVPKVRGAANAEIVGLMVSLNRMEVGKGGEKSALEEVKDTYGFETNAIVTMEEVVEHLHNREYKGKVVIDDTLKQAIDKYYEQYGVK